MLRSGPQDLVCKGDDTGEQRPVGAPETFTTTDAERVSEGHGGLRGGMSAAVWHERNAAASLTQTSAKTIQHAWDTLGDANSAKGMTRVCTSAAATQKKCRLQAVKSLLCCQTVYRATALQHFLLKRLPTVDWLWSLRSSVKDDIVRDDGKTRDRIGIY